MQCILVLLVQQREQTSMSAHLPGTEGDQSLGLMPLSFEDAYSKETDNVTVLVRPVFLEEQSIPTEDHYVWAYQIRIVNQSKDVLQLNSRHWFITDAMGFSQEIHGSGVVGEHPTLRPGDVYEYTSGAALSTPSGMMHGHYHMHTEDGQVLRVLIPAFSLDSPHQVVMLN